MACDVASAAIFLAAEITQVMDSIPWVRCASGNVWELHTCVSRFNLNQTIKAAREGTFWVAKKPDFYPEAI